MSNRRSHQRYEVAIPVEGSLRLVREVRIQEASSGSVVAVGASPETAGDLLELDVVAATDRVSLPVRVEGSRPVMVDGGLRYELRLVVVDAEGGLCGEDPRTGHANVRTFARRADGAGGVSGR